jgi:hypothetical protein
MGLELPHVYDQNITLTIDVNLHLLDLNNRASRKAGPPGTQAIYCTLLAWLKSRAVRAIGSEVKATSGWFS